MTKNRLAVIGAGPIGLESALYAAQLGFDIVVFEKNEIGGNMLKWGHVVLFSPWEMNCSALGVSEIKNDCPDWHEPDADAFLTGAEYVAKYLQPLSELPTLKDKIHTGIKVLSIGKESILKGDLIGSQDRAKHKFKLLVSDRDGNERYEFVDYVLDASGVYGNPNFIGDGGIPALGELKNQPQMDYHICDIYSKDRSRFAGKKTLLVGTGYSAATTICDFVNLMKEEPDTELVWAIRQNRQIPIPAIVDDPLSGRAKITAIANEAAQSQNNNVEFISNASISKIEYHEKSDQFNVTLKTDENTQDIAVDRIIANVGYGPDNSLYRELQVHECYASRGPMKLAAALLGASSADCLEQQSLGAATLKNPEPNFFIIGNKSYGRNSTFLIRIGLEQIVEIFSLITGKPELNLYAGSNIENGKNHNTLAANNENKITEKAISSDETETAWAPLHQLDTLWFQVGGTICNLWCTHCFISCSPKNHKFGFMKRETVRQYLEESKGIGVKEYYFTGGEPFMNHEMLGILEDTLAIGPATVLTNGILIQERTAKQLKKIVDNSEFSLEIRVSIDGFTPETNDKIRGAGSFEKAMNGVKNLVRYSFLPIITAAQTWEDSETETVFDGFKKMLTSIGYNRPRFKTIPPLRIGREKVRSHGYDKYEYITKAMLQDYDENLLQCTSGRMVTDKGVYVCPILIDYPEAKVADTLQDSFVPYALKNQACYTCYISGAICHNFSSSNSNN